MAHDDSLPDSTRSLQSAIPRPISGTSRRDTSVHRLHSCMANPPVGVDRARRPSRRSIGVEESGNYSISSLPKTLLLQSGTQLRYRRDQTNNEASEHMTARPPRSGLPKSHTTPALLSPNKDVTSHRLLAPVDPPLPRSHTYTGIGALKVLSTPGSHALKGALQFSTDHDVNRRELDMQREGAKVSRTIFANNTMIKSRHGPDTDLPDGLEDHRENDPQFVGDFSMSCIF